MAFDPMPVHFVSCGRVDQCLPKLGILDRLTIGRLPAVSFPSVDPFGYSIANVIAVRIEAHPAGALERFQPLNGSHELHPIVGGKSFPTAYFLFAMS